MLWFAYPRRNSKVEMDLTRDNGWEPVEALGLAGIAQVSVDETWSASRFRPAEDVRSAAARVPMRERTPRGRR